MKVVYIDVDSLRADHVGSYGYEADTTPNIDEFAKEAVQFNRAYVANSPCLPSRAALVSGRYGINNGIETHGKGGQVLRSPHNWNEWLATWSEDWEESGRDALAEYNGESAEWQTLPELFFHKRIQTGAVSSFPRHTAPWFYHLWHEYYHPQEPDASGEYMQTPGAETVAELASDFIDSHADEDFFLYTQFWEPHMPYNRDEEEVEQFTDTSLPPHPTDDQIDAHHDRSPSSAQHVGISSREELSDLLAKYDAEIAHVDRHIGHLFDQLRELDIYDEALIVVTADHGEEFGEHGMYGQHWSTHDGTQRVPYVIKPPVDTNTTTGERNHLVTNVDMAPTIADYADLEPPENWQGTSLRPILEDSGADGRDHIVFDHGLMTAQRAVRTDGWKFIKTYHPGLYEEALDDRQLFDMESDPWEQKNVAEQHPDIANRLESKMLQWAEDHVGRFEDPLHAVARNGPPHSKWEYWSQDRS